MAPFRRNAKTTWQDHYQELTDRVLEALEAGAKPWQKPWDPAKAGGGMATPVNAATGRRYRGINTLILSISPLAFMNQDPRWASYQQASQRGWQVRKGEKSTRIFFYRTREVADPNGAATGNETATKSIPLMRTFNVFHASQIDGIAPFTPQNTPKTLPERIYDAEIILKNSEVAIRIGGDRAFYSPATDHIQLPPDSAFISPEARAATLLHELAHASGAKHRLGRDLSGRFGSQLYSLEELRAEITSCFVGETIGLPSDIQNHANYIGSWISVLKEDKKALFRAAADAQKIADYLLSLHPAYAAPDQDAGEADDSNDTDDLKEPADPAIAA